MPTNAMETKTIPGTQIDRKGAVLNVVNKLFIDRSDKTDLHKISDGDWARLARKITTMTPSSNETSQQTADYAGNGFGNTDITSKRFQLAISGQRFVGDPAQEYISSKLFAIGQSLHTRAIWINNGQPIVGEVTLTAVVPTGGEASANQTFSVTLEFDGAPKAIDGQLTLTEKDDEHWVYTASVASSTDENPVAVIVPSTAEDDSDANANQSGADQSHTGYGHGGNASTPVSDHTQSGSGSSADHS